MRKRSRCTSGHSKFPSRMVPKPIEVVPCFRMLLPEACSKCDLGETAPRHTHNVVGTCFHKQPRKHATADTRARPRKPAAGLGISRINVYGVPRLPLSPDCLPRLPMCMVSPDCHADPAEDRPADRQAADGILSPADEPATSPDVLRPALASRNCSQHDKAAAGLSRQRPLVLVPIPRVDAQSSHPQHTHPLRADRIKMAGRLGVFYRAFLTRFPVDPFSRSPDSDHSPFSPSIIFSMSIFRIGL